MRERAWSSSPSLSPNHLMTSVARLVSEEVQVEFEVDLVDESRELLELGHALASLFDQSPGLLDGVPGLFHGLFEYSGGFFGGLLLAVENGNETAGLSLEIVAHAVLGLANAEGASRASVESVERAAYRGLPFLQRFEHRVGPLFSRGDPFELFSDECLGPDISLGKRLEPDTGLGEHLVGLM